MKPPHLLRRVTYPTGAWSEFDYAPIVGTASFTTWVIPDERDARGRVLRSVDALGNETEFGHDALGRLTSILDAQNNLTSIGYDSWGRRTLLADPDTSQCGPDPLLCPWTWDWNVDGTQAARTDAKGQTLQYGWDSLGRMAWRSGGCESSPGFPCADPGQGTSFF